jgi:hypothetical protein
VLAGQAASALSNVLRGQRPLDGSTRDCVIIGDHPFGETSLNGQHRIQTLHRLYQFRRLQGCDFGFSCPPQETPILLHYVAALHVMAFIL